MEFLVPDMGMDSRVMWFVIRDFLVAFLAGIAPTALGLWMLKQLVRWMVGKSKSIEV